MTKKAQVKFGETIGIIIIVYLVIVAGFVWYNQVNTKNIQEIYEKDQIDRAFEKYHYIVNLHLIHSSQRGNIDEDFDLIALQSLSEYGKTPEGFEYLRRTLGESKVSYSILTDDTNVDGDPILKPETGIVLYDNEPDLTDNSRKLVPQNFRTLIPAIDESNRRTEIVLLQITDYIEQ